MRLAATHQWRLSALFDGLEAQLCGADIAIGGLALDSREVLTGDCFLAVNGTHHRGVEFVPEAAGRGAAAVALETGEADPTVPLPCVQVTGLRSKVGLLAARLCDHPSRSLQVIAITGTNGKTTVAHLCAQALTGLESPCGYVGTLGVGTTDCLRETGMTTPDPLRLQSELARMRDEGLVAVAIEASSHALAQARLGGTEIRIAVFTGLGHDHLDYHASPADYLAAKQLLFTHPGLRHAVINLDDPFAASIFGVLAPEIAVWGFSLEDRKCDLPIAPAHFARVLKGDYGRDQTSLEVEVGASRVKIESKLLGDFNAQNLLAGLGVLLALGHQPEAAAKALSRVTPVCGRLEPLGAPGSPRVYIDYAHSPDSLERVLRVLRGFGPQRLFCVFGCGGNRDRSKRALMGEVASRLADVVYLTSDNPRCEDPVAIARDVQAGMPAGSHCEVIHDRKAAITQALGAAVAGDIVLIAGKGHESTQEYAGRKFPFRDAEVVREWLATR